MSYTNKQLNQIIEKANKQKVVTHITDKSQLTLDDRVKMGLCRHFVQYSVEHDVSLTEMSKMTGLAVSRLSEITNYKIKKFTASQLLKHLELMAKHDSRIRQYVSFLEQVVESPILSVQRTRQLSKDFERAISAGL